VNVGSTSPLLSAQDLRVDVDGVPTCDGLAFETTAERVLVLGAPRALFEAACGLRPVVRGSLAVWGATPARAVDERVVVGAPLDPPLPPRWTALEYVVWSARLAGHSKADAARLAAAAVAAVQLGPLAKGALGTLPVHARRGVVLAAALATDARVVLLEDPLSTLPDEVARTFARIVVAAIADRSWAVFAPRVPLTSPLAMAAEEAFVVSSSRVDAQGAPAEIAAAERRYVARVHGSVEALGARLAERGARIDVQGAQVVLDLGETLTTAEVLGMALEANVTVVELVPVARALA